jgi:predicted nucleotidyltransferase
MNVKVEGFIDSIYNSYFTLKDVNKSEKIVVSYLGGKNLYLDNGKEIIVKGVLTYDSENFRYIINLYSENHGVFIRG